MASETADFYLRLHEDVNAPARRAASAIRQLSGGLVTSQKELAATDRALASLYRRQAAAPAKAAAARRGAAATFVGAVGGGLLGGTGGQVLGGLAGGEMGFLGAGAAIAAAGVSSLISLAKEAASTVFDIGVAFAKTTADAVDFGQRSRLAFGALVGDAKVGATAFDEVRREAQRLGLDVRNTVDDFRLLLAAQFSIGESKELMRAGADLKAIGADAEHIKLALLALSQIKMKGVLQAEEMRQLVNTGVSAELIYNALAKSLGKTRAQVLAMQRDRQITAPMAIDAFKTAIREKTHEGALGETGAHFADSKISGQLAQARGRIENWFVDLGNRVEPAATRISTMAFGLFNQLADSPAVENFADFVVKEFEGVETWVKEHWGEIGTTAQETLDDVVAGAKELWGNIKGLATEDNWETFRQFIKEAPKDVWLLVEPFVALAKALAAIAHFGNAFNQFNNDLGDSIGKALGLDTEFGRKVLGYESNADKKKREAAATGTTAGTLGAIAGAAPAGGKSVTIGTLSVTNHVTTADVAEANGLGDALDKKVEQSLLMMLDRAS